LQQGFDKLNLAAQGNSPTLRLSSPVPAALAQAGQVSNSPFSILHSPITNSHLLITIIHPL
ncbi:MAG: hypothetical protein M3R47_13635, partial [Chloroflexota bacterium]|nr:hypothetical protein [Chloroflexota bacterium]